MRASRFAICEDTLFLYCRLQKWVEGGWTTLDTDTKTTKNDITRQISIQITHSRQEIRYQGGAKPLGQVPSPETARERAKNVKMRVLAPVCAPPGTTEPPDADHLPADMTILMSQHTHTRTTFAKGRATTCKGFFCRNSFRKG